MHWCMLPPVKAYSDDSASSDKPILKQRMPLGRRQDDLCLNLQTLKKCTDFFYFYVHRNT